MTRQRAIERRIALCAGAQHGLVARRQLLAMGLHPEAINSRVRSGRLVPVDRGVYALGHAQLRREGRLLAAVLAVGPDAVLSHRSAAGLWGLRPFGGTFVEMTIRSHRGRKPRRDLRVHRSKELRSDEMTVLDGIPVTTVARTLLDLAAVVPPHHLRRAVERAEKDELFDLRQLQDVLGAHCRHAGRRPLVALLDDAHAHGLPTTRSDVEAFVLQVCLDHALPRPQVNRHDGTNEVDFRWPEHRLVVEVDGWSTHRSRKAFNNDRTRDRRHVHAGWRVVRFTAVEAQRDPKTFAAEIRALTRPAPSHVRGRDT